jgi:kynureninase
MNDLLKYRSHFDSLTNCHYLISNSLGAMPNKARDYINQYAETWASRGVRAWEEGWWMMARETGDRLASIMGAPPDSVTMVPNVTTAETVVLSAMDFSAQRSKVVMVDMEFPSLIYLYREWLKGQGELEIVECSDRVTVPIERLLDAIDDTTLLVPISHVLFRSSYIVDAKAIVEKAHRVGAMVILDMYQSLGSVPVDVSALDVDFAVGGCIKWLCGGPGACYLYCRPDISKEIDPRFTGWLAHTRPFDFDTGPIDRAEGAYRFLSGTPAVPALYACRAGLEIISEIGVERIRERSKVMTEKLIACAIDRGWKSTTPPDPEHRAGTVTVDIDKGYAIASELKARNYLVDYRPKAGIRISPHFYNTDSELDDVLEEISIIIDDRSYEKHLGAKKTVT